MHIRKLSDVGGVEVEGVDLSAPRSPDEDREIGRLYDIHGLVVFRSQKLTKHQLLSAGAPFGGILIDPPAVAPDPEAPGIITLSTRGAFGDKMPEDQEALLGDLEWHTDGAFVAAPNRGKIMYAVQVPEEGGMTGFIDGQLTYNALSEDMKRRIADLHVIQSWKRAESYMARNRAYRIDADKAMPPDKFPDVAYPIVYNHPVTGEKVLNVPPMWAAGIVEMPGAEGDALLEELKQHAVQEKFQYWHRYRVGDALLWDNWRSLHAASGTPGRYVRTLWSVMIKSGPALGRVLPKAA